MNPFDVLSNPDFWIASSIAFIIAIVFATIAQDVWDTLNDIKFEESLLPIDRPIEVGEVLYDIREECEVIYVGQSGVYCIVVYQEDYTVFIIKTLFENLRFIEE